MAHFTLVRHSAYSVAGNPQFEQAVELREIDTQEVYRVRAAGGVVLETYEAAQAAEAAANFPGGIKGTGPRVQGYFSSLRIGGAEIYVRRKT
jgi:hypothetical protein